MTLARSARSVCGASSLNAPAKSRPASSENSASRAGRFSKTLFISDIQRKIQLKLSHADRSTARA